MYFIESGIYFIQMLPRMFKPGEMVILFKVTVKLCFIFVA